MVEKDKTLIALRENIERLIRNNPDKKWSGLRAATNQAFVAELKRCETHFSLQTLIKAARYLDVNVYDLFKPEGSVEK